MGDQFIQWVGIAAGFCTAISLLPQVVKMVKNRKAEDISIVYLLVLLAGLALWIVYGILRKDIPVIVTNVLSLIINLTTIALGLKYKKQYNGS